MKYVLQIILHISVLTLIMKFLFQTRYLAAVPKIRMFYEKNYQVLSDNLAQK